MYKKNQEHCERKIILVAISAAGTCGFFRNRQSICPTIYGTGFRTAG